MEVPSPVLATRDHAVPVDRVPWESTCVVLAPPIIKVGRSTFRPQPNGLEVKCRLPFHGVVLENEIAETVEDGFAVVDLHRPRNMRAMTQKRVSTSVNTRSRKGLQELRRIIRGVATLVAVERHKHPVGHPAGVLDPLQVFVHVALVWPGRLAKVFAENELPAEEAKLGVIVLHYRALGPEPTLCRVARFEPQVAADALHRVERRTVDSVGH